MNRNRSEFTRTISSLLGIVIISVLVATAFSGSVAGHTGDTGAYHHDDSMGTHDGTGGWIVGGFGILWVILWTVVLIGISVALTYLLLSRRRVTDENALALPRRRYAQGEIDEEEFEIRRAKLLAGQHRTLTFYTSL
jgi:putative membrane protein